MRLFSSYVRVVFLAACLLAAAPGAAQEGLFGPTASEYEERPNVFVKFEALSLGLSVPHFLAVQAPRVTLTVQNFRVGASLGEAYGLIFSGAGQVELPVHVGYTLFSTPRKTLFFYNMTPEVYAEVAAAFWKTKMVPFVRGSVYAGIEGYGLGAGLEVGVASLAWQGLSIDPHPSEPIRRLTSPYVAIRLKLLALTVGF